MSPRISVLMPVYNGEKFLAASIESILKQTYQDFELLIWNDASTDNSENIIQSFKDSRIKYHKALQNAGISESRNQLMRLAKGEYWAIIDHDDIAHPQRLEKQVEFLDAHPEISVVGSAIRLFCKNPRAGIFKNFIRNLGWIWKQPSHPTLSDALKGCPLMHPSAMLRGKDFIHQKLFYKQEYTPAEDYKLWSDTLMSGLKLANIQEVLLYYNLHGENCSVRRKTQMRQADRKVKNDIKKFLNIKSRFHYPYFLVILQKLRLSLKKDKNI